jgi:hypothetical protein
MTGVNISNIYGKRKQEEDPVMSSTADENIHHITVEELMNEKAPCYY